MNDLSKKALSGVAWFAGFLGLMLFVSAGSLRFWQGWIYWLLSSLLVLDVTLYFLKHDPRLIERRTTVGPGAEPRESQKRIQRVIFVFGSVLFILPGLDYRKHWSVVPVALVLVADAALVMGYVIIYYVFRENTFTAGVVTVEEGQRVIDTGPYAVVRHPLYAAMLLQFLATPVALGSWWALFAAVPLCVLLCIRLLDEERLLCESLAGYPEYCERVTHRLIPYLW